MPSTDLLIPFFAAAAVFAYVPGPAVLYAMAQTLARGRRAGLMASLGIHLGGYVHVAAAAGGLSILFHAVPVLYTVTKLAGAAYLVWLGIQMIRSQADKPVTAPAATAKSAQRAFVESIAVEVLNPKTALFFLAFLPQFVDPSSSLPVWAQFLALGTIVNVMFGSADVLYVTLADAMMKRLRSTGGVQRWLRWLGGGLLVGLGVRLAAQRS